jgi:3-methyladenine DNA glycosylase Tag
MPLFGTGANIIEISNIRVATRKSVGSVKAFKKRDFLFVSPTNAHTHRRAAAVGLKHFYGFPQK